jgi:hypothetical protein
LRERLDGERIDPQYGTRGRVVIVIESGVRGEVGKTRSRLVVQRRKGSGKVIR